MTCPAVFLDRDGTIARDVHYCRRPEDFEILPTVPEAIRLLNESGFKSLLHRKSRKKARPPVWRTLSAGALRCPTSYWKSAFTPSSPVSSR